MKPLFSDDLHLHRPGRHRCARDRRSFGVLPKRLPSAHQAVGLDEDEVRQFEEGGG